MPLEQGLGPGRCHLVENGILVEAAVGGKTLLGYVTDVSAFMLEVRLVSTSTPQPGALAQLIIAIPGQVYIEMDAQIFHVFPARKIWINISDRHAMKRLVTTIMALGRSRLGSIEARIVPSPAVMLGRSAP